MFIFNYSEENLDYKLDPLHFVLFSDRVAETSKEELNIEDY